MSLTDAKRTSERVDEKVTELVLVDRTVRFGCLFSHNSHGGLLQLTSSEKDRHSFAVAVISTEL